jgi:hypothetical protein
MGVAYSFEQGSYFIFDIVESKEVAPVPGRLALAKLVMAEVDVVVKSEAPETRSEFEFDYSQKTQTGRFRGLDLGGLGITPSESSTDPTKTPTGTGFDMGTAPFNFEQ